MTGADLLAAAVTELYSADPDEFVGRRADLAAQARAAGETATAKRIAALRKPTRSAWVVNQLARSAPGKVAELSRLGGQLRDAQRSTNGEAIMELSQRRRQLVDGLVRQALTASGQRSPSAALRDEVAATLSAAVADPQVADKLAAGTLERAVRREGFGPAGVLTLVTAQPDGAAARSGTGRAGPEDGKAARRRGAAGRQGSGGRPGPASPGGGARPGKPSPGGGGRPGKVSPRGAESAEPAQAERERRRQDAQADSERERRAQAESERQRRLDAVGEAEREAAEADRAAAAATAAEAEQEEAVRALEEQLAEARVRLADTRAQARRLRAGQRRARQALGRLLR